MSRRRRIKDDTTTEDDAEEDDDGDDEEEGSDEDEPDQKRRRVTGGKDKKPSAKKAAVKKPPPKKPAAKKPAPKKTAPKPAGKSESAQKRLDTIKLRKTVEEAADEAAAKKRISLVTARQRLQQLARYDATVAAAYTIKSVEDLPFETRTMLLDANPPRTLSDEVLWCNLCSIVVKHAESTVAKKHVTDTKAHQTTSKEAPVQAAPCVSTTKSDPTTTASFQKAWALALVIAGITPHQASILALPMTTPLPKPRTLLGKAPLFVAEIQKKIRDCITGRPVALGVDGTGLRHLGFAIMSVVAYVGGRGVLLLSKVRGDGEVHNAEDVGDVLDEVRELYGITRSTVVADFGSVNVKAFGDKKEEGIYCLGHHLNAALKRAVRQSYPRAYAFCTLVSQFFGCKSRRHRWKKFQAQGAERMHDAATNIRDTHLRVRTALDRGAVRALRKLLPSVNVTDTDAVVLERAAAFVAETDDTHAANVEVSSPQQPASTSDTRWAAMFDLTVHLQTRCAMLLQFVSVEMARKKKPLTLRQLSEHIQKGTWEEHVSETVAVAEMVEPVLWLVRWVQNPEARLGHIKVRTITEEYQKVVTNTSYPAPIRTLLKDAWESWPSKARFEMALIFDPETVLMADFDDFPDITNQLVWAVDFHALADDECWAEFTQYLNAPAESLQTDTPIAFWLEKGRKLFPILAPHVVAWLRTPVSVTQVDSVFSTQSPASPSGGRTSRRRPTRIVCSCSGTATSSATSTRATGSQKPSKGTMSLMIPLRRTNPRLRWISFRRGDGGGGGRRARSSVRDVVPVLFGGRVGGGG